MGESVKYQMSEDRIPRAWYNIAADLPRRRRPCCTPAPASRSAPTISRRCSRWRSSGRRSAPSATIEIPDPVREIYRLWRPTPLYRARAAGEEARHHARASSTSTRASARPAATSPTPPSRRPSTTSRKASRSSRPRPARGSGAPRSPSPARLFGLEVKVFMVRVSYDQKPYRRALMETYGAECVASPSMETESGRAILAANPDTPGSLGIAISEAVEVAAKNPDTKYCARQRAQSRAAAPDGDRP